MITWRFEDYEDHVQAITCTCTRLYLPRDSMVENAVMDNEQLT